MTFPVWEYDFPNLEALEDTRIGGRVYLTPNGMRYPSITTVTGHYKKEAMKAWRKRVGNDEANRVSRIATTRGTKVHALAEDYIKGTLNESALDDDTADMFGFLKEQIDGSLQEVLAQETTLWSDMLRVAGRTDLIAKWKGTNGKVARTVVDFKTSMKPKKIEWISDYFWQATAYACMFEEVTGLPVSRLAVLIAVADSDEAPAQLQIFESSRNRWLDETIEKIEQYHSIRWNSVESLADPSMI